MRRLLAIALCGWMLGAASAFAQEDEEDASEHEDVTERAKARFKDGVAAFEAARYDAALAAFVEANELKPHPSVLVNIANCHDKLGHAAEATQHYERFLEQGEPSPEQRKEIVAALKRLRARLGTLVLRVRPEGAQVSIDGAEPQDASEEPHTLAAGEHVIEATLRGHDPARREIDVEGGGRLDIEIVLEPEAAEVAAAALVAAASADEKPAAPTTEAPPSAAASEPASGGGIPLAAWVTGGATVVVLAGALVTGVLALDANSEFDEQVARRHRMDVSSTERILAYNAARDAADRAQTLAVATDVLLGLGIVGAGMTVYFLIAGGDDEHAARDVSLAGNGVRIAF